MKLSHRIDRKTQNVVSNVLDQYSIANLSHSRCNFLSSLKEVKHSSVHKNLPPFIRLDSITIMHRHDATHVTEHKIKIEILTATIAQVSICLCVRHQ